MRPPASTKPASAANLPAKEARKPGRAGAASDQAADSPEDSGGRQWLAAPDLAGQKRIAAQIQAQAFVDVPFLPLGQFFQPTTRGRTLEGGLTGMPLFWNIRRRA